MNDFAPELLQEASDAFDQLCRDRHAAGAEQYGDVNFLQVDTLRMGMEEVVDLANYARYTYIKLYLLQRALTGDNEMVSTGVVNDQGFQSVKDSWGK